MINLRATGVVESWDGETLRLATFRGGYASHDEPAIVYVETGKMQHVATGGEVVVCLGSFYQRRPTDDRLEIVMVADTVVVVDDIETSDVGAMYVDCHAKIAEIHLDTAISGPRAGDKVCRLLLHVRSLHMDPGEPVVLRAKAWGPQASALVKAHEIGDLILVEGTLNEARWEKDGVARTAHEILVRRWGFAKERWTCNRCGSHLKPWIELCRECWGSR